MKREIRTIITIDKDACNGCGLCVEACHEGALALVDGKAQLMHEHYCDGLGDCLPKCPTGAITFEKREAAAYDEEAVLENQRKHQAISQEDTQENTLPSGCPGSMAKEFNKPTSDSEPLDSEPVTIDSELRQWPIQIQLVNPMAPYFRGADLLIAADCTAFAYGDFHRDYMKGKITLIGCPKLDSIDYTEKLTEILSANSIHSVTVARMQVPCCAGIEFATKDAVKNSGKDIPVEVVTFSTDGQVV